MEKVLCCFYKISSKLCMNLKRHNRVYILSSKHTCRPMRVYIVAQLIYKKKSNSSNLSDFESSIYKLSHLISKQGTLLSNCNL